MGQNNSDFFYFSEVTSPNPKDVGEVQYKKESLGNVWWLRFPTCLHVFELVNRNTRQYLGDNVMEHIFSPKNKSMMKHNGWWGEMDHPAPIIEGQKLTRKRVLNIWMPNRSHKIIDPIRKGNRLNADIETCSGTEVGRGFANEIIQGHIPPFSCRSTGDLKIINGKPTVIVTSVVTYDWVPYAGFEDAQMEGTAKVQSKPVVLESGDQSSRDLMIPFSELAEDLENDARVGIYMESFDNDAQLIGVTNDRSSAIIKHDGLYIYAGMEKKSVDRARDFYRSFNL